MNKKALITGINGQDGSYLAELLLEKGYEVYGIYRLKSGSLNQNEEFKRIIKIKDKITLFPCNIEGYAGVLKIINEVKPDEVYHLAAQSFVGDSFRDIHSTFKTNINGTLNIVTILKEYYPKTRLYFAATSEMFGEVYETPQTENTKFHPRSPYGVSKVTGFELMRNYRESYDLFFCSGILFNHESPRRGDIFVTRKITKALCRIKLEKQEVLELGNLDAKRDWGHAKDYVKAMWLILQQETPDDFVIATNKNYSIRDFVNISCEKLGIEIVWEGEGIDEIGIDKITKKTIVKINEKNINSLSSSKLLINLFVACKSISQYFSLK